MDKTLTIHYQDYPGIEALPADDRSLVQCAVDAAGRAYAPYSHFSVGAAVRLADGTIVDGNNQENLAYPSGLCAERVALFSASAHYGANAVIDAIAMVARDSEGRLAEASPCGACRQVMIEYERRQRRPMRVILRLADGQIRCFDSVKSLLPFAFSADL